MSYIVLARKYRPQKFDELIGQEHIITLLKDSITTKRLAHAYLFCGPRGVGKTSCARILAKSLNCKEGPTVTPCGVCPACKEIAQTTSFDVIEIDGASNRGIDEIRTLRENVKFAPSYGRYKIYIVDEVHMLTTEAFNALLKTLEEPPEHVKFIFATTSPNKVPATIISRCQRFDFRRISVELISKSLSAICAKEKLKIEPDALFAVSKAASGSLRDALSILDQLGALKERNIKVDDVTSMLGMVEVELLFKLADCLGQKNCAAALTAFDGIINQGKDIRQLSRDIVEHFRNLMIIKIGGTALSGMIDYPVATKEMLLTQSGLFTLKEIIDSIETFMEAQETARVMDSLRIPLEVAFAKLTYTPEGAGTKQKETGPAPTQKQPEKPPTKNAAQWSAPLDVLSNRKGQVDFSPRIDKEEPKDDLTLGAETKMAIVASELTLEHIKKSWDAVTHAISREKMSVATFLQEGSPYEVNGSKLVISFPKEAAFHKESLEQKDCAKLVERIFSEKLRTDIRIEFKVVDDFKPPEDAPFIKTALDTFKGKVVNKWHSE